MELASSAKAEERMRWRYVGSLELLALFLILGCCSNSPVLRNSEDTFTGASISGTRENRISVDDGVLLLDLVKVSQGDANRYFFDLSFYSDFPVNILAQNSLQIKCNEQIFSFSASWEPALISTRRGAFEHAKYPVSDPAIFTQLGDCASIRVRVVGKTKVLTGDYREENYRVTKAFAERFVPVRPTVNESVKPKQIPYLPAYPTKQTIQETH